MIIREPGSPAPDTFGHKQTTNVDSWSTQLTNFMYARDWGAMQTVLEEIVHTLSVEQQDAATLDAVYKLLKREQTQASEFATVEEEANKNTFKQYRALVEGNVEKIFELKQKKLVEEAGPDISSAWDLALSEHPELKRIQVQKSTPEKDTVLNHTAGFFRRPSEWGGTPTIVIASDAPEDHFEKLKETRRRSSEIISKLIDVPYEELTARTLKIFIFLHELGHAKDFMSHVKNNDTQSYGVAAQAWKKQYDAEMSGLPIPGMNPSKLRTAIDEGRLNEILSAQSGSQIREDMTPDEIMAIQDEAYRHLPKEAYADNFAAEIIRKNRDLFI